MRGTSSRATGSSWSRSCATAGSASATTTSKAVRPPAISCTVRGQGCGEFLGDRVGCADGDLDRLRLGGCRGGISSLRFVAWVWSGVLPEAVRKIDLWSAIERSACVDGCALSALSLMSGCWKRWGGFGDGWTYRALVRHRRGSNELCGGWQREPTGGEIHGV